jgi:hypothetical protein
MMFRIPDKIDSVRSLLAQQNRANDTSHVKGFSYDSNLGVVSKPNARKGKDKWKIDKSALVPARKKNVIIVTNRRAYGLFDS